MFMKDPTGRDADDIAYNTLAKVWPVTTRKTQAATKSAAHLTRRR